MPLPTSRNTTYSALSQVQSDDLNDLQDFIVDHETRIDAAEANISDHNTRLDDLEDAISGDEHGFADFAVTLDKGRITGGAPASTLNLTNYYWRFDGVTEQVIWEIPATEGMVLEGVKMRCTPAGTAVLLIEVYPVTDGVVGSSLAGGTTSSSGTGAQTVTRTFTTPRAIAAGEVMLIAVSYTSGAGDADVTALAARLSRAS